MKKVELSEAKAMLKEILAATSASHESIGAVLKLGRSPVESTSIRLSLSELDKPFQAIAIAAQSAQGGVILVDDQNWQDLENSYYHRVTKHILF